MSDAKYIIGIDLGTTHCVLTYTQKDQPESGSPEIRLLQIPQIVSPNELKTQALLPSFLLLPGPHDVPESSLSLPWDDSMRYAVGEFARKRGAEIPNRLVSSAKSWLCHAGVDRTQPILPWGAPEDTQRVSPVEATTRYLLHIRYAWNNEFARDNASLRLENQEVYLTVPASFDAVARELTAQAAQTAGLQHLTLLEEPQAAFYAWLEAQKNDWRKQVSIGETVLVCDVGGGTTDFSLIRVTEDDGDLQLNRIAVGNHILLGGDNMDLTLAYAVQAKLAQKGTKLDQWQFRSLWLSCRSAKEKLLNDPTRDSEPIALLGRGSSLIGGTIRTELTREELQTVLLQGFFPIGEKHDFPQVQSRVGMREMGLPYAQDVAITRHLAEFLHHEISESGSDEVAFPSAILFNGGVMKAAGMRKNVLSALEKWSDQPIRELPSMDLDLAVAYGAAYYGLARQGKGIRIRAGINRTYYIGVESSMPAVPGIPTPMKALCVVPFGMEEGSEAEIRNKEFGLVVGEPAVFHLLAATHNKNDAAGEIVEDWSGDIQEVATLEVSLPASSDAGGGTVIPVWLESKVTEVGTLELWCVSRDDDRRWKLEFDVRA